MIVIPIAGNYYWYLIKKYPGISLLRTKFYCQPIMLFCNDMFIKLMKNYLPLLTVRLHYFRVYQNENGNHQTTILCWRLFLCCLFFKFQLLRVENDRSMICFSFILKKNPCVEKVC